MSLYARHIPSATVEVIAGKNRGKKGVIVTRLTDEMVMVKLEGRNRKYCCKGLKIL